MWILLLTILLACAPFIAAETGPEPPTDADKPKQATGPLSPQESGYTLVIEGRDFCADTQPGEWYEGYIVIRTDEEPAQIDFVIEECACGFKGETSKGIFYSDVETTIVVAPPPGKARPQDFELEAKDGLVRLRLSHDEKSRYPATHCLGETP